MIPCLHIRMSQYTNMVIFQLKPCHQLSMFSLVSCAVSTWCLNSVQIEYKIQCPLFLDFQHMCPFVAPTGVHLIQFYLIEFLYFVPFYPYSPQTQTYVSHKKHCQNRNNCFLIYVLMWWIRRIWYLYANTILNSMQIRREICTMKLIKHPNVVKLHEVKFKNQPMLPRFIVAPY